jgi:hypothetical protein
VHVVALVLVRVLRDADDFANWDLTAFLNANVWDSLWELLNQPVVHFRNPFSFPQMNVGGDLSSMLLLRLRSCEPLLVERRVLLVYDAAFLALLAALLRESGTSTPRRLGGSSSRCPNLTDLSRHRRSACGPCDVLLGLLGCQYLKEAHSRGALS